MVCLHVLLPCPVSSMSHGGLMSSCEADVCLELASPGLGRLVSHQWGSKTRETLSEAFVLGTGKAGPAGDSLVEQPEHDTSVPRDSWQQGREETRLLCDLARQGMQHWPLHCLQHLLPSQSCGRGGPLDRSPEWHRAGRTWWSCPQPCGAGVGSCHCPISVASPCPGVWLQLLGDAPTPAPCSDGGWDRQH